MGKRMMEPPDGGVVRIGARGPVFCRYADDDVPGSERWGERCWCGYGPSGGLLRITWLEVERLAEPDEPIVLVPGSGAVSAGGATRGDGRRLEWGVVYGEGRWVGCTDRSDAETLAPHVAGGRLAYRLVTTSGYAIPRESGPSGE